MNRKVIWGAQLAVVALCALALKYHYSTATPDQLRWILAPTALLVDVLSGKSFAFESYTGYMSSDHTFVIAAPCAGVNYLITAFLMLTLRHLWRNRFEAKWHFIPLAAVVAFGATLIANTTRICIALSDLEISWLNASQQHRLEGIVVYFGFLLLLFLVTDRLQSVTPSRLLIPLAVYYAVTLGLPLLNGSFKQGHAFWEHVAFVLVLPLFLVVPLAVFISCKPTQQVQGMIDGRN